MDYQFLNLSNRLYRNIENKTKNVNIWRLFVSHFTSFGFRKKSKFSKETDLTSKGTFLHDDYDPPGFTATMQPDYTVAPPWRPHDGKSMPGFSVTAKYRIALPQQITAGRKLDVTYSRDTKSTNEYTDYCGLRFPTLDTMENTNYWKDTGFKRFVPRVFPIKLPMHRKVDPLMREYVHFLHTLEPARFTIARIAERYDFSQNTISRIIREYSLSNFIRYHRLCDVNDKRITLEEARLQVKEKAYKDNIGYVFQGDYNGDNDGFSGSKDTADWVYRQSIKVESMSAFPLPSTRNPMPKRVDVDLTVSNTRHVKVINWIDPTDKVVI